MTIDEYVLNNLHQIEHLTRTSGSGTVDEEVVHDTDGRRHEDHRFGYRYDAMGHLREVRDKAGTMVLRQEYDPLGRVSRREGGSQPAERLRHLGLRQIQDETPDGTAIRQRCLGLHADELVAQSDGTDQWGHQDARLSLLAVSGANGASTERYAYAPFGMPSIWAPDGVTPRSASSVGVTPVFGGHRAILFEGLYDARSRIYDADLSNYLQPDPRGYGDSADLYAYLGHNPVDLVDPTGEVLPIIAALVIIGALAGAGYSFYDASEHPERYQGPFSFRAFGNVVGGAIVGAGSALAGELVLATVGMGSLAGGSATLAGGSLLSAGAVGGGTLTLAQTFVLGGTVSATSGLVWRYGFNGLFPEQVEPPSAGTMAFDYAFGGTVGLVFRTMEAIGNPFSRAGRETIRLNLKEAWIRTRSWANRAVGNADRAAQLGRDIAEVRVGRYHAEELQQLNYRQESLALRVPGEGQRVVFNAEIDAVVDSAWIQVKASATPGRAARFNLAQAEYTALGSPTGRSIYYVEPGSGYSGVVRDLLKAGVSEVRPLVPWLRGTQPFPLPFQGTLGLPAARLPGFLLDPASVPPGGGASASK